jgi:hypothetical protein
MGGPGLTFETWVPLDHQTQAPKTRFENLLSN